MNKNRYRNEIVSRLYILSKSEINIIESVEVLCRIYKGKQKKSLLKLKRDIERGKSLKEAFKNIDKSNEFLSYIHIAEKTGNVKEVFGILNEKYVFEEKMYKEVVNIISYPLFLLITTFVILIFMLIFLVPRFVEIYEELNAELPYITKLIIKLSKNIVEYKLYLIFFLLSKLMLIRYLIKVYKYKIDRYKFIIKIYRDQFLLRYIQGIYMQLKSGIDFYDAIKNIDILENDYFKLEMNKIILKLGKGMSLNKIYANKIIFDDEFNAIISITEKTGDLISSFEGLYVIYSSRVKEKVRIILKMLEPLSIVVIALIVGLILIALMMPMLSIGEVII